MDEKLILANGMEIRGHLLETGGVLFLYMREISLQEAFGFLIEPENTETIKWERFGEIGKATGYSHLYTITEERDGTISAGLKNG